MSRLACDAAHEEHFLPDLAGPPELEGQGLKHSHTSTALYTLEADVLPRPEETLGLREHAWRVQARCT